VFCLLNSFHDNWFVMQTRVQRIQPDCSLNEQLQSAVEILQAAGLVAIPTETVYGLAANALSSAAVAGIYEAKGRPAQNPLIVHVANIEQARSLVTDWPEIAQQLAAAFWPGPLTLVLPKSAIVPDIVTAGGTTVALRQPQQPITLALLQQTGFPLAAPSANPSNQLSPTTAEHVLAGLSGKVPLILDGGPCQGGIESTVVDLTSDPPRILRHGLISASQLLPYLPELSWNGHAVTEVTSEQTPLTSPGQLSRHYCPRIPLHCYRDPQAITSLLQEATTSLAVVLPASSAVQIPSAKSALQVGYCPANPAEYAAQIYALLHELEDSSATKIILEIPPATTDWLAVRDRLRRAASLWQE
jgi:L-threonylcarbamoyladenylate synthase